SRTAVTNAIWWLVLRNTCYAGTLKARSALGPVAVRPRFSKTHFRTRAENGLQLACSEPKELLRRTEGAQRLQGRRRLRRCLLAADSGGVDFVADVRSAIVGNEKFRGAAGPRACLGPDHLLGIRADTGWN